LLTSEGVPVLSIKSINFVAEKTNQSMEKILQLQTILATDN
jgi:hypothetical protein